VVITNRTRGPIPEFDLTSAGVPLGTGGGCVHSGPFVNYTVNMGSVMYLDPTRYNPRCLKRDLNPYVCAHWASIRNTTETILNGTNIELFQAIAQGGARYPEAANLFFGVHGGGHFTISK
jgi:tyrosinase